MQKELNPELFGTGVAGNSRFKGSEAPTPTRVMQQTEEKLSEVRSHLNFLMAQMESLVSQVNEYIKSSEQKFERFHATLKKFENSNVTQKAELDQRFTHVHQRMNERKNMDAKFQEMVDRHNGILRSYEVRMNNLQKILAEKDAQVLEAQVALNETKMEIARLKRL